MGVHMTLRFKPHIDGVRFVEIDFMRAAGRRDVLRGHNKKDVLTDAECYLVEAQLRRWANHSRGFWWDGKTERRGQRATLLGGP